MMLSKYVHVPIGISLGFIVLVVLTVAVASLISTKPHRASTP
jgi:hypothetical protein